MLARIELGPDRVATSGILGDWALSWGAAVKGADVRLAHAHALDALLDLREHCYRQGLTLRVEFPVEE